VASPLCVSASTWGNRVMDNTSPGNASGRRLKQPTISVHQLVEGEYQVTQFREAEQIVSSAPYMPVATPAFASAPVMVKGMVYALTDRAALYFLGKCTHPVQARRGFSATQLCGSIMSRLIIVVSLPQARATMWHDNCPGQKWWRDRHTGTSTPDRE
jgi:hypothetical protein